jgi:hypothetical protein
MADRLQERDMRALIAVLVIIVAFLGAIWIFTGAPAVKLLPNANAPISQVAPTQPEPTSPEEEKK